ncbi:MBL fold metallo-hydrolase [Nocardioides sp.]|uniref:MBL fold metallo-hydrolase n=1 Tax=Nocardioides sp. TaxID=35761 RepID=UPI0037851044
MSDGLPQLLEIAPDLFRLRIPGDGAHLLNSYVWRGPEDVALFDTGWPGSARTIEAALRHLGRRRDDVRYVVLSHFHEDHSGAAAEIATWPNTLIVSGADEAAVVRGDLPGVRPQFTEAERQIHPEPDAPPRAPAVRVDLEVAGGDLLPIAGGAEVLHLPGHTPGSIGLHLPELDAVLTGDAVAELHGSVIRGVFNTDRDEVRRSVAAIAGTGASIAGVGHGEPITHNASRLVADAPDPFA